MNWTWNDIYLVIDYAKKRGGDCSLLVAYVVSKVLEAEAIATLPRDNTAPSPSL